MNESTRRSRRRRTNAPEPQISVVRQGALDALSRLFLYASLGTLSLVVLLAIVGFIRPASDEKQQAIAASTSATPRKTFVQIVATPEPTDEVIDLPTPAPSPSRTPDLRPEIAILAGHWSYEDPNGEPTLHDSGAVCPDGLREVDINKSVADKLLAILERRGHHVTILEEFDSRLKRFNPDFTAKVFLAIHSDSCVGGPEYPLATGYKIAHAEPSENPAEDDRLVACLKDSYGRAVEPYKLTWNQFTITPDMTVYHAFREIVPTTPAAIIELGFMHKDRVVLTQHQDELARGLAIGLVQFLNGDRCGIPSESETATETPTP